MSVVLNHTIVPVADKSAGARFFADLLGLHIREEAGPFAPVQVNTDLTFDRHGVQPGHYAFLVDDDAFDAVLERLRCDPTMGAARFE